MTKRKWLAASLVSERQSVHGTFIPQAYSIGLTADLLNTVNNLPKYPIAFSDPEQRKGFSDALTLYHEATHFAQFITTSFGLQIARMTNICSNRLSQEGPWELPILAMPFGKIEGETLDRLLAFKYLFNSLQPISSVTQTPFGMRMSSSPTIVARPASPVLYLLDEEHDIAEAISLIKGSNAQIHAEYHVITPTGKGNFNDVTLNVAALMEGYAQMAELHHISNALGDFTATDLADVLDSALPIYSAATVVYGLIFSLPFNYLILHLTALIDIALMYSPHLLFNIGPCHSLAAGGTQYKMPAEVFVDACGAAQRVKPILDHSPTEVQRCEDEVCDVLKIPRTKEMTDVALQRLAQIGIKNKEDCEAILADERPMHRGKLFTLHWLGLNYRKQHGDGFCADLFKTDYLIDMINLAASHVTFYDLATGVPFGFHPGRIITSCLI